jgi:hypothetical protein
MSGCVTGKKMYDSMEIAEEVLIEAWSRYDYGSGRGPVAVYRCDDCGRYHLTSSGEMNPKLAEYLRNGKIQLQKEANHWLNKLKRK